ncbi:MAG: penicillin acylase family protein [Euryarchaeota archaeon]|nr:penicillin acylase family protein [Euryarchaeota archaeon]
MNVPLTLLLSALVVIPAGALLALGPDEADPDLPADIREGGARSMQTLGDASGLDAVIIRDQWGVPHIYADDAYSLFFGNGYAQAQDRLAQLEILRHVGKGELAKLTGPSGLELDLVTRRELYTHDERVAAFDALPDEWKVAFEAYADGVNRWIGEVTLDPTQLPVEYPALAVTPEPWQVTDTIAIAQYLLDVFGRGSGGQEVRNAQLLSHLVQKLGPEAGQRAFGDVVWTLRNETYTTIKAADGAYPPLAGEIGFDTPLSDVPPGQLEAIAAALQAEPVDDTAATLGEATQKAGLPFKFGSNAQLIDKRFAANGKPLLFGGPQMGYYTPMIPYELGLHGAGFDATGMGVAGAPGVIIGRSATQAWTVTSGASDQVDTVAERLVDFYHYEIDGEVHEMDCRIETHHVRPGPADFAPKADPEWRPPMFDIVEQEVCRTVHGPVLWRSDDGAYAFASERSYRGDEVASGVLWLSIGMSRNLEEFQDTFEEFSFTFNFNYVNESGTVAYMHVGRQPIRDERLDPRLPRPAWDSAYDWKGTLSGRELPHVIDPASGYTVNWNNNPAQGWTSGDARELWGPIHRAERMEEELLPVLLRGDVTLDDLREVNFRASTREPYADDLEPVWRQAAAELGLLHVTQAIDDWKAAGFTYWDHDGDGFHDHSAFRLYELWRERLQVIALEDELGDAAEVPLWDPPTAGDPHAADHGEHRNKDSLIVDSLSGYATHDWCDDIRTPLDESCLDISKQALLDAMADEPDWFKPFPQREIRFVALGAGPAYKIPMQNKPSFQNFYDWGLPEGPERSRNALPPGTSGHLPPAAFLELQAYRNGFPNAAPPPHLEDQLEMYATFGDKPLLFGRTAVEQYEESRTHLKT